MFDRIVTWRLFVGVGLLLAARESSGQVPAATKEPEPAPLFAGFVGRHDVVRVPAEQVEFLDKSGAP